MSLVEIRNFKQDDMPLLGEFYHTVAVDKKVVFWWIGSEENWDNVFCAFENNQMIAKGQVQIINIIPDGRKEDSKHAIYLNLKTLPERETDLELLHKVYEKLHTRALELKQTLSPKHETNFCVGNFGTEVNNNEFFTQEKGFAPLNTLYTMKRDLHQPIEQVKLLNDQLQWEYWKMSSAEDEKQYLEVEAEIWPDSALGLNRLHEYKNNNLWTAITVRENDILIGSTMAWQEDDMGVVEDVFVRSNWRKQGIAKFLLTTALTYLKDKGLDAARLMVDTENENALSLYKSVGFEIIEEEKRFFIELN